MLPSVYYVILARRIQQKSRWQTNGQCLVYSDVQSDRTSNHFSSFSIILMILIKLFKEKENYQMINRVS